jgi:hypothetical protein
VNLRISCLIFTFKNHKPYFFVIEYQNQNYGYKNFLHIDSNHLLWQQSWSNGFIKPQSDYTSTKEEIENKIQEYQGIVIRSRFKIDLTRSS